LNNTGAIFYVKKMIKFLSIDDDHDNLTKLEVLLSDSFEDIVVIKALSGKEGINMSVFEQPDVIFLSDLMPEMDGYEFCSVLKNDERVKHIPIIILTASNTRKKAWVKALNAGADAVVFRPVNESELVVQVKAMLRIKNSEDKIRSEKKLQENLIIDNSEVLKTKLRGKEKIEKKLRRAFVMLEKGRTASLNILEDFRDEVNFRKTAEAELIESELKYKQLFQTMQEGFALHEIINDENGKPADYRFLDVNHAFEKLTGSVAKEVIGESVHKVLKGAKKIWIEKYGRVANKNIAGIEFEHFSSELKKHFRIKAFSPVRGQLATLFEDITERRTLENILIKSEQKFRAIFESVGTGLVYLNNSGQILDVNPAFENISGFSKEDLIGKNALALATKNLTKTESSGLLKVISNSLKGKPASSFVFRYNNKFLSLTSFNNRNKDMIIATVDDLTELKKSEDNRLRLLIRQEAILGAVPDILMEINTDNVYTWANKSGYEFFGKSVIGKSSDFYLVGKQNVLFEFADLFKGKAESRYIESVQRRKDGETRQLSWWYKPLKNLDGEVIGALSSARDITEIKNKETELEKSREQLEQLNLYLHRVRENERKRISRELHDELGQALTAIKIDLGALNLNTYDKKSIKSKLSKISLLVSDSITTVKRLTSELRPHILDDLGLEAALSWYTADFIKRTGINIELRLNRNIKLPSEIELVIFRIFQESLTNIARHSKANNIEINFYRIKSRIILEVEDNGIGISAKDRTSMESFGLINMNERAKEIGGTLLIEKGKEKGTRVCLTLTDILFEE
jgi:PAS domain S-box-containing protein